MNGIRTALMALTDRANWANVILVRESHRPGWQWAWSKERLGAVIVERARMIEAGELTAHLPRKKA